MADGVGKMLVSFMNFTVQKGGLKEFKFWATMSSISRRSVHMNYFTAVCWLIMF